MDSKVKEIVEKIISLFIPETTKLSSEDLQTVEKDVHLFVLGQIESMPKYMKKPYNFAVSIFNFFSIFSHGNLFIKLPIEKQKSYLNKWRTSNSPNKRNILKPILTFTLFSFYDHPIIRKSLESGESI